MTRANLKPMKMQNFDDLFGGKENKYGEDISNPPFEIELWKLNEFSDHPFKVNDDEKMQDLVESIKTYGVLNPAVARIREDGELELISGHRRKFACEKAGLETMPVRIIEGLSDDDATILMVQSNFCQREEISPSEKARAYKKEFEARKHQGTAGGITTHAIGESSGDSAKTVQRYIRLSYLSDELLDLVDEKRIGLVQGVELSYLTLDEQAVVFEAVSLSNNAMSVEQAVKLKEMAQKGSLIFEAVMYVLSDKKPKEKHFKMKYDRIRSYFNDDTSDAEIEEKIIELLERWKGEI